MPTIGITSSIWVVPVKLELIRETRDIECETAFGAGHKAVRLGTPLGDGKCRNSRRWHEPDAPYAMVEVLGLGVEVQDQLSQIGKFAESTAGWRHGDAGWQLFEVMKGLIGI